MNSFIKWGCTNFVTDRSKQHHALSLNSIAFASSFAPVSRAKYSRDYNLNNLFLHQSSSTQIPCNPEVIIRILDNPEVCKCVGPANTSDSIKKNASPFAKTPLAYLINLCIGSSCIQSEWKIAKVIPNFKKGILLILKTISLLCTTLKVFEAYIVDQLSEFYLKKNLHTTS